MKFVVDAQLPPALARWIASHGHDAVHVFDLGVHRVDDKEIRARARSENAVIISKTKTSLTVGYSSTNQFL